MDIFRYVILNPFQIIDQKWYTSSIDRKRLQTFIDSIWKSWNMIFWEQPQCRLFDLFVKKLNFQFDIFEIKSPSPNVNT